MDKTLCNKFLKSCFRQTVYVHRITADKQGKGLNLFSITVRIGTVERLHFIDGTNLRLSAACRAGIWNFNAVAACEILCNLRNDHVCLIHCNFVADAEL